MKTAQSFFKSFNWFYFISWKQGNENCKISVATERTARSLHKFIASKYKSAILNIQYSNGYIRQVEN